MLANECRRSKRSGLAHYLLPVHRDMPEGETASMDEPVAAVLAACLRKTDYIGWYRDGLVVGGVLTAMGPEFGDDQIENLRGCIVGTLRRELGEKDSGGFQVLNASATIEG